MLQRGDTNPILESILAHARWVMANRWKYAGFRFATFAPVDHPFDPAVVKRFHEEIGEDVAFLWLRHIWISPSGSEHYFDYHVIASDSENCTEFEEDATGPKKIIPPHRDFQRGVMQPYFGKLVHPHSYIEILHAKSRHLPQKILGLFEPLSMKHFHKFRRITWLHSQIKRKNLNEAEVEKVYAEIRAVDAHFQSESDYRWDSDWNHLMGLVDKLDASEREAIRESAIRQSNFIGHTLPSEIAASLRQQGVPVT